VVLLIALEIRNKKINNMIIMLKQHWVILLKTKATHFNHPPQSVETQASVDHAITDAACETNHSQLRTPRARLLPNMSVGSFSIHASQQGRFDLQQCRFGVAVV
jgi:hypothetical protein